VRYGFECRILVPAYTPTTSPNTFVVQFGYDGRGDWPHSQAGSVEAPQVRRIADAVVGSSSRVNGRESVVTLRFRTVTDVPSGGGIVATGPTGFGASSKACHLVNTDVTHECHFSDASITTTVRAIDVFPAGSYTLRVPTRNPSSPTADAASPGIWRVVTYVDLSSEPRQAVDHEGSAPSFRVSAPMTAAGIVVGNFCAREAVRDCATEDQQYQKTGRSDQPGKRNSLIFSLRLAADSEPGLLVVRAPSGFVWASECSVVVAATEVFGTPSTLPAGYEAWPVTAMVSSCSGLNNAVSFEVSHSVGLGLKSGMLYAFRIAWATNPLQAPTENLWSVEFSGQASEPFQGFPLWTFPYLMIIPHTKARGVSNSVSLHIAAHSGVGVDGYLSITAPSGFIIPKKCQLSISTEIPSNPWETEKLFFPGDFLCQGIDLEVNQVSVSTNVAKVFFVKKAILAGVRYIFHLSVSNPVVATDAPGRWCFVTYRKLWWFRTVDRYEQLDSAELPGFSVSDRVAAFFLNTPPPVNGLAEARWDFTIKFTEAIYATDIIRFDAPSGYVLHADTGPLACSQFRLLGGPLSLSSNGASPCYINYTCTYSLMMWQFRRCLTFSGPLPDTSGQCVPKEVALQFSLTTQNPDSTPALNFYSLEHASREGRVFSSSAINAYTIVPLLENVQVLLRPSGDLGVASQAEGSDSAVQISFVPRGVALAVIIEGKVLTSSFRFTSVYPTDVVTGARLTVNKREFSKIILSMPQPMVPDQEIRILLHRIGLPLTSGISMWNVATYANYNSVLGPQVKVNEMLNIVGFDVLGYISVLTTSTLKPKEYYGLQDASCELYFHSSVPMARGDKVLITAPRNYAFQSGLVSSGGAFRPMHVVVEDAAGQAPTVSGGYVLLEAVEHLGVDGPVFRQNTGLHYMYPLVDVGAWAISATAGQEVSGRVGECIAKPSVVTFPFVTEIQAMQWEVGIGTGWVPAPGLNVLAEGGLESGGRNLVLELGAELPTTTTAAIVAPLALPSEEQVERNWLFRAQRGSDRVFYATNDWQYSGFALLFKVTFSVTPSLQAPRAQSVMTLAFEQRMRLRAERSVRYELSGPTSFRFPPNCFASTELLKTKQLFFRCIGASSTASLVSTTPSDIKGLSDVLQTDLVVNMPAETPLLNLWILHYYLDESSIYSGQGESIGFNIVPMNVSLKGNNQLSATAPAYFTIQPQHDVSAGFSIRITAPISQRYGMSCWSVRQGTLPKMPQCTEPGSYTAVELKLAEGGELVAGRTYTIGVGVTNSARTIPQPMNRWSVVIYDDFGNVQDASYTVDGMELTSLRLMVPDEIVLEEASNGVLAYRIPIVLRRTLPLVLVSVLRVTPPADFRITGLEASAGLLLVLPALASDREPKAVVAGAGGGESATEARGSVHLLPGVAAELPLAGSAQRGNHALRVTGVPAMAPAQGSDGTWLFQAVGGDGKVHFQHVLASPVAPLPHP